MVELGMKPRMRAAWVMDAAPVDGTPDDVAQEEFSSARALKCSAKGTPLPLEIVQRRASRS
jgi:hypothetical protein